MVCHCRNNARASRPWVYFLSFKVVFHTLRIFQTALMETKWTYYNLCIFVSTWNVKIWMLIQKHWAKKQRRKHCSLEDFIKIKPSLLTEHFLVIIILETKQHLLRATDWKYRLVWEYLVSPSSWRQDACWLGNGWSRNLNAISIQFPIVGVFPPTRIFSSSCLSAERPPLLFLSLWQKNMTKAQGGSMWYKRQTSRCWLYWPFKKCK